MTAAISVARQLKTSLHSFTPSEKKIARVLLADYPVAGLESVSKLAQRAHVSAPTVLRLVMKLGYGSYLELQDKLRAEIAQRAVSPIDQYVPTESVDNSLGVAAKTYSVAVEQGLTQIDQQEFELLIDLLQQPRQRIWVTGGRYSRLVAEYFVTHLRLMRENVQIIANDETAKSLALLDIGAKDTVIIFDYRRYQPSAERFAARAASNRAKVVVFTDPWLSPAAKYAELVYSAPVTAPGAFDSLVPALALVETVIAALLQRLNSSALARIQAFDTWEE